MGLSPSFEFVLVMIQGPCIGCPALLVVSEVYPHLDGIPARVTSVPESMSFVALRSLGWLIGFPRPTFTGCHHVGT